ncbi:MAG: universal stress protein [Vicinamibacterales bacterium]
MTQFTQLLCPVDFSDPSIRALAYAARLAGWYQAALEVLHVVPAFEDDMAASSDVTGPWSPLASRPMVMAELERCVAAAGGGGAPPEIVAPAGRPHDVLTARARALPADLIVMGTHGRGGFNRVLLGSVTEKVLRSVSCPVLTVPPSASPTVAADIHFRGILCAVDYSPSALKALQYALDLARQTGGCLTVLYALEYMDPEEPCEHVDFDIRRRRQHFLDHARARLHMQLEQEPLHGCELRELIVIDRAYRAILKEAAESAADLIVMGAQGTGGLELMLYGSNTQHVVRAASCPVLTVHA